MSKQKVTGVVLNGHVCHTVQHLDFLKQIYEREDKDRYDRTLFVLCVAGGIGGDEGTGARI
jgi:hypothetical protein